MQISGYSAASQNVSIPQAIAATQSITPFIPSRTADYLNLGLSLMIGIQTMQLPQQPAWLTQPVDPYYLPGGPYQSMLGSLSPIPPMGDPRMASFYGNTDPVTGLSWDTLRPFTDDPFTNVTPSMVPANMPGGFNSGLYPGGVQTMTTSTDRMSQIAVAFNQLFGPSSNAFRPPLNSPFRGV
jgi:hypothetical protein